MAIDANRLLQLREESKKGTSPNGVETRTEKILRLRKESESSQARAQATGTWFKGGAFDDGYQIGDVTKTTLGTVGDLGVNVVKGAGSLVEGVTDLLGYAGAGVADLVGADQFAQDWKKSVQRSTVDDIFGGAESFVDRYSVLGDKSDAIAQGIGQIGGIIATGGLGSAAGLSGAGLTALTAGITGASGMGRGMSEAYAGGATDAEAVTYGAISGTAEALTEMLFAGLGKGVKALGFGRGLSSADDMLAKKVASKINSQIGKNFAEWGIKAGAEGTEEVLAGIANIAGKKLTYLSEEEIGKIIEDENLLEQFIAGTITSGIAQSGIVPGMRSGSLIEANRAGRDFISDGATVGQESTETGERDSQAGAGPKNSATQTDGAAQNQSIGIKDQIRGKQNELNKMLPVAQIQVPARYGQMDITEKKNWVIEKLRSTGYKVERKGFGIIDFAKKRLKSAFNYFDKNSAEEVVFEALPYVLENGIEISENANHKDRNYETVTIAAPITVGGKRGNMAVVVKQTNGNYYKVHRILAPDGTLFALPETTNEAESTPAGGVTDNGSLATPKDSAYNNSIRESAPVVNMENGAQAEARATAAQTAVDRAQTGGYDNSTNTGGVNYGTGEQVRQAQNDGGADQGNTEGYDGVQTENGNRSGIQSPGGRGAETLGRDSGVRPEEITSELFSNNEKGALLAYKSGGSYLLNAKLREDIALEQWEQEIVDGLDSAMEKLPAYVGTTYRNLVFDDFGGQEARDNFIAQHAIGRIITYPAFTSSSSQQDGYPVEGSLPVHVEIDSMTGKDIDGFGNNFEKEILFARNTSFEVTDIRYDNGVPTIYLMEVTNERAAVDGGRNQEAHSGDHRGQQKESAKGDRSEVQRLPEERARQVQPISQRDSEGDIDKQRNLRGVRAEVTPTADEPVGAAPSGFDPFSHAQYEHGTQKEGANAVRDDSVPVSIDGKSKVSHVAVNVKGAQVTPDDFVPLLEKDVVENGMSFIPTTNDETVQKVTEEIQRVGWEQALGAWKKGVEQGQTGADMAAMGAVLLNNAAHSGDKDTWLDILHHYQTLGTKTAQGLQAFRILKTLTPSDKLYMAKKALKQMVDEMGLEQEITIDGALEQEFLDADTDQQRDEVLVKIQKAAAEQIPATWLQKWTALRYVNMLGNLRTQGRNIMGNTVMAAVNHAKNAVATGIEGIVSKASGGQFQRTKSFTVSKEQLAAAKKDYEGVKKIIAGNGKYNEINEASDFARGVREQQPIFKNKALEGYRKATNWAMEQGDAIFSKAAYARALAGYLKSNGATGTDYSQMDSKALDEARLYAIKQAQEVTFRDSNWLSNWVSKIGRRKGKDGTPTVGKAVAEGVLPFRRTPANILVRAAEYSPLGLVGALYNSAKLAKGDKSITGAQVVDSWAKGITGTGLFALGMLMSSLGCLEAGAEDDDKEEQFQDLNGLQNYAIVLPDGTNLTIDWVSPAAIPLFMGAELYEQTQENGFQLKDLEKALLSIADPMVEMSMLQGVNDALESVQYADGGIMQLAVNAGLSYLTQGLTNTALGQLERSFEKSRMTTYVDKESAVPDWLQRVIGKASAKTPVFDYNQMPYINAWGEEEEKPDFIANLLSNTLSPSYFDKVESTPFTEELQRLQGAQDYKNVYPSVAAKTVSVNGESRNLTQKEYVALAKLQGQTSKKIAQEITESEYYKGLSDVQKAKAISYAYAYAREKARVDTLDDYKEYSDKWMEGIAGKEAETILRKVAAGGADKFASVGVDVAAYAADVISRLTPQAGHKTVRDVQKWEAVLNAGSISDTDKVALLYELMDEKQEQKHKNAGRLGLSDKQFVDAYAKYLDTEGKGKSQTVRQYFVKELGLSPSTAQKLYEIYSGKA